MSLASYFWYIVIAVARHLRIYTVAETLSAYVRPQQVANQTLRNSASASRRLRLEGPVL
jgi:hypothetical protein